jgi:hypothetical protein
MGKQNVPDYIKEAVNLCKHFYNKHGIRKANCCKIESKKYSRARNACSSNVIVAHTQNRKHKAKNHRLVKCKRCYCELLPKNIQKHEAKCTKGNVYNSQTHTVNEKCESPRTEKLD